MTGTVDEGPFFHGTVADLRMGDLRHRRIPVELSYLKW